MLWGWFLKIETELAAILWCLLAGEIVSRNLYGYVIE